MTAPPVNYGKLAQTLAKGAELIKGLADLARLFAGPEPTEDPWRIVGVTPQDPWELVERVYRAKAKALHPDTKGTGNEEAYKRLQQAYTHLKNGRRTP